MCHALALSLAVLAYKAGYKPVNASECEHELAKRERLPTSSELESALALFSRLPILMIGDSTMEDKHSYLTEHGVGNACSGSGGGVCFVRYEASTCVAPHGIHGCSHFVLRNFSACDRSIVPHSTRRSDWRLVLWNPGSLHALGLGVDWQRRGNSRPTESTLPDFRSGIASCASRLTGHFPSALRVLALSNQICSGNFGDPLASELSMVRRTGSEDPSSTLLFDETVGVRAHGFAQVDLTTSAPRMPRLHAQRAHRPSADSCSSV